MYRIKQEKIDELKEGKTIIYLSKLIGYARPYLNDIFTGKILVDESKAIKILQPICKESYKLNQRLEKNGINSMINYFFKKIN